MAQGVREKKWIDEKKMKKVTRKSFIIFVFVDVSEMMVSPVAAVWITHTLIGPQERGCSCLQASSEQDHQVIYNHDFWTDFLDWSNASTGMLDPA
jgi:hypothetical protein